MLTGLDTKGLEFDGIVVVRPQEIEDESATGRATLYVVLTRGHPAADDPVLRDRTISPGSPAVVPADA